MPGKPDLSCWTDAKLAACWLGHATVLLKVGALTMLTDPVFSRRVGLGLGFATMGPARIVAPSLRLRELPAVDIVLLSHAHFDHLDRPTLWQLASHFPKAALITAAGLNDLTCDLPFAQRVEVKLGESITLVNTTFTAWPVRHWSARMIRDTHREACSFLIERSSRRVLFGGDSAFGDHWTPIGRQGGVDLAIVGIGAYDPWIDGHASPEQAWKMAVEHARARHMLAMHHSTFKLSVEPMREPMERLLRIAGADSHRIVASTIAHCWCDPRASE
ncbi:MAG: MBL fold metallo-hydrolase [Tepidisphaeraceae bacterium]